MSTKKRVAVLGAGLCGIGAIKSVLEENLEPVCFERTSYHGGLWRYHEDDVEGVASVMRTTVINHSKEMGCLSDIVPPAESPNYMHNREIYQFLEMIMKKYDMFQYIKYNKDVNKVEFAEDYQETGRYVVTVTDTKTGEIEKDTFDAVFVAVGHHAYPNWATFPGQEKFKGNIIHTHSLKKVDTYLDKKVVVVGIGNSGADAAVEISNVSKQVYLSTRRGGWIVPRIGPEGLPMDLFFNRRIFFLLQNWMPYSWFCTILETILQRNFNHSTFNLKPKHRILSQHPTVSDTLPVRLLSGTVVIKGNIKRFTEDGVIFEGETEVTPVDEVVLATGYNVHFPFLGDEITSIKNNEVYLYKYIYPPHLPHPTLAMLGLVQPLGAGFPVGEAQCRLAVYALTGKAKLPGRKKMEEDIEEYRRIYRSRFVDSPRHTVSCDFISYIDELNELFGAKPNMWKMFFTDPRLWFALMFGPHLAYQYRLQGPNPWSGAREAIFNYRYRVLRPLQSTRLSTDSKKKSSKLLTRPVIISKMFLLFSMLWFMFPNIQDNMMYIVKNFY